MIENMSYHECSKCGNIEHLFSHDGARRTAEQLGIPFLAEIPLDLAIRTRADQGTPIVAAEPDSRLAKIYLDVASQILAALNKADGAPARAPSISMDD